MDDITPYHARQYSAVLFGYKRGRAEVAQQYARLIDRLIRSRRAWQGRAFEADHRMNRASGEFEALRAANTQWARLAARLWRSRRSWQSDALSAKERVRETVAQRDRNSRLNRQRNRLLRKVWASRRDWQQRALDADRRLGLVEALCGLEQLRGGAVDAPVRADWITYATDPKLFTKPEGWDEVHAVIRRSLDNGGPENVSV